MRFSRTFPIKRFAMIFALGITSAPTPCFAAQELDEDFAVDLEKGPEIRDEGLPINQVSFGILGGYGMMSPLTDGNFADSFILGYKFERSLGLGFFALSHPSVTNTLGEWERPVSVGVDTNFWVVPKVPNLAAVASVGVRIFSSTVGYVFGGKIEYDIPVGGIFFFSSQVSYLWGASKVGGSSANVLIGLKFEKDFYDRD